MFAKIDEDGNTFQLIYYIVDHRTDGSEVTQQDASVTTRTDITRRRETTEGWEIPIECKNSSTGWVKLKDFKESYRVQLAEYAV